MKKEKIEAFFALLTAGLWEKEVRLSQFRDIDYNELYRLAQEQSVLGLVLQGIEWFKNHNLNALEISGTSERARADIDLNIPKALLLQWIGEVQVIEQQNKKMNAFVADLIEKLRKNGIYTLLVKGQGIAQCYEKPLWRCSGDVDLFLSESNYEKAKAFLMPMAETIDPEWKTSMHLGMTIDGWVVELHGSLRGSLSTRINRELEEIKHETFYDGKVRSWINNGTHIFLLDANNDIIYVFTHFLNHFYKGGIGLRQICDWCRLLWNYRSVIKVTLLEKRLTEMGLMTEWRAFGAFAVEWLGMPVDAMPFYSPAAKWKRKAQKICSFIMEVGNFDA